MNFRAKDFVLPILVIQTFLFPTKSWLQNLPRIGYNIECCKTITMRYRCIGNCAVINHYSSPLARKENKPHCQKLAMIRNGLPSILSKSVTFEIDTVVAVL